MLGFYKQGINLQAALHKKASRSVAKSDTPNLGSIRKPGVTISRSANQRQVIVTYSKQRAIAADLFIDLLNKDNPDSEFYDADIDDNELIAKTKKPLWQVSQRGNSFVLTRV